MSNDVISKDLISSVLDLGSSFLKLADTDIGKVVTQLTLLAGIVGAGSKLLGLSKIIPGIVGSLAPLGGVFATAATGAATFSANLAAMGPAIGLAVAAIAGLVIAASELDKALDPMVQIEKSLQSFSEAQAGIDKSSRIIELADQYDELRSKINSGKLSTEELESATTQLNDVRSELASLTDGLISTEAEYGDQLDHTVDVVRGLNEQQLQQYKYDLLQSLNEGLDEYIELSSRARSYSIALTKAEEKRSIAYDNLKDSGEGYYQTALNLIEATRGLDSDNNEFKTNLQQLQTMYQILTGTTVDFEGSLTQAEMAFGSFTPSIENARNAFNILNSGVNEWQTQLDEVTEKTSAYENNVIQGFILGVTDQAQALNYLQAATEKTVTESDLASKVWKSVSLSLNTGKISMEEAIEVMGRLGWSAEAVVRTMYSDWKQYSVGTDAAKGFTDAVDEQVDALLSLEDELAAAQLALQGYQDALAGGDRGDLADTLEGIFGQIQEDVAAGYINTKQQEEFFKLIFNDEGLEEYGKDIETRLKTINADWMQALFNTEEGATLGTNLLSLAASYANAAGDYYENGELIASFKEVNGELQLQSLNLEALQQQWGLSDTLITAIADDLRGMGYDIGPTRAELLGMAEDLNALTEAADGTITLDLTSFITGLSQTEGITSDKISSIIGYLMELDGITIDPGEITYDNFDEIVDKAIETKGNLEEIGDTPVSAKVDADTDSANENIEEVEEKGEKLEKTTFTPKVSADISSAQRLLSTIERRLEGLNNKTVTSYVNVVTTNTTTSSGGTKIKETAAEGTDYAVGGPTLVNEEGPEIIRENDKAFIAGNGRPTIIDLARGAQVFTAEETKDILKGRGMGNYIYAYAVGTVGNPLGLTIKKPGSSTSGKSSGSSSGSGSSSSYSSGSGSSSYSSGSSGSSASSAASTVASTTAEISEATQFIIDKHQKIISLLESEYNLLVKQEAPTEQINNKAEEIQKAYDAFSDELKKSSEYLAKNPEVLKDVIDNSITWYGWQEKIKDLIIESTELYTNTQNLLNSQLNLLEAQKASLDDRVKVIKEYQAGLQEEANRLKDILANADAIGLSEAEVADIQSKINELSREWWQYQDKINTATQEIFNNYQTSYTTAFTSLQKRMQDWYDNQIQSLKDANDALKEQVELEEKLNDLAEAKQNKVLVFANGRWQYAEDLDKVSAASKALEDYEREQAQNQAIDELEELKSAWGKLTKEYEDIQDDWLIAQNFGINTTLDNWQKLVKSAEDYAEDYLAIMGYLEYATNQNTGAANMFSGNLGGLYDNKSDYAKKLNDAKSYEEALLWARLRDAKISDKNISGVKSTSVLLDNWLRKHGYASGTLSASGGISLVGENGPELRLLNKGDGILPTNFTQNLMNWGQMTPKQYAQKANLSGTNLHVTIQTLSLPNVSDGMGFVDYVRNNMFGQVMSFVH